MLRFVLLLFVFKFSLIHSFIHCVSVFVCDMCVCDMCVPVAHGTQVGVRSQLFSESVLFVCLFLVFCLFFSLPCES